MGVWTAHLLKNKHISHVIHAAWRIGSYSLFSSHLGWKTLHIQYVAAFDCLSQQTEHDFFLAFAFVSAQPTYSLTHSGSIDCMLRENEMPLFVWAAEIPVNANVGESVKNFTYCTASTLEEFCCIHDLKLICMYVSRSDSYKVTSFFAFIWHIFSKGFWIKGGRGATKFLLGLASHHASIQCCTWSEWGISK